MKRTLCMLVGLLLVGTSMAQDPKAPFRIQIRHADPWMVKALLEGLPVQSPEMSTLPGFKGIGAAAANAAGKLLQSGHLVVNPTDNSLWLFPTK